MANEKKSACFLLGQIYERTEALPVIESDIKSMKEKLNKDHFRITALEKDVRKSAGFNIWKLINTLLGK